MSDVVLDPALFEAVEAGPDAFIEAWCVAEGDHVHAGQTLAHARLVRRSIDIAATHAGVVEEIVVAAGEAFAPGAVLARLVAT